MKYIKRISDKKLERYARIFGAVLIEGPKWCGKTCSGKQVAGSVYELTDPSGNFRNRSIAHIDPNVALDGERPRLIDEWQEVPGLWDAVRHRVDSGDGGYILTGSSTPDDGRVIHSGTGRIGRMKMSTMSLAELGVSNSTVSLGDLLCGNPTIPTALPGKLSFDDVVGLICKGGWPGLIDYDVDDSMEIMHSYISTLAEEDLSKIDNVRRDPAKVMALLQSVSRNTATLVSKETIRKDIEQYSRDLLHPSTVDEYLNLLRRVFVLTEIPAWSAGLKSTVRLRTAPKRVLTDPSLAVAALRATPLSLKEDLRFAGNLFETLALHDLSVYSNANGANLYHYRDNTGLEVDAVIEGKDKEWGAIEVKLGYVGEDDAARSLLRFVAKLNGLVQKKPRFLAVVTGVGGILRCRDDGILTIPIDHLGA